MRKWARWVTKWPLFKPEQSPRGGAEGKNQLHATSEELEVASGFSRRSVPYSRTLSSEPWAEGRQSVPSLPSHQSISEKGRPGRGPLAQGHRALALWPSNQECLVGTFRWSLHYPENPILVSFSKPRPPRESSNKEKVPNGPVMHSWRLLQPPPLKLPAAQVTVAPPAPPPALNFWPYSACGGQTRHHLLAYSLYNLPAFVCGSSFSNPESCFAQINPLLYFFYLGLLSWWRNLLQAAENLLRSPQ